MPDKTFDLLMEKNDECEALKMIIRNILSALPEKRDWLDPDLEKVAKFMTERIGD